MKEENADKQRFFFLN